MGGTAAGQVGHDGLQLWAYFRLYFGLISYVDCDMDSYMPGGGGMLATDIEANRWSKTVPSTPLQLQLKLHYNSIQLHYTTLH